MIQKVLLWQWHSAHLRIALVLAINGYNDVFIKIEIDCRFNIEFRFVYSINSFKLKFILIHSFMLKCSLIPYYDYFKQLHKKDFSFLISWSNPRSSTMIFIHAETYIKYTQANVTLYTANCFQWDLHVFYQKEQLM